MFAQLEAPDIAVDQRQQLVEQVTIELVRHSVAEEQWLYPAVRQLVADGDTIADKELAEHAEVEEALKGLEQLPAQEPAYADAVAAMMADVRHHLKEEEGELFPKLVAASSPEELRELGAKIEKAKKVAPTRPHPSSPSTPPANRILDPGAGLIDRLRDALTGRG